MMLLLIILYLFPIMSAGGVYTNNITDISGILGTYTEYVSMANNAATIGMGLSLIIFFRIKTRFHLKTYFISSLTLVALLIYVAGTTDNPWVFITTNFFIGFFKMMPMMDIVMPVMFILSPQGDRGRFYSIFYPISIGGSSYVGYKFSQLAFDHGITSVYLLYTVVLLFLAIVSVIFMHNSRFSKKTPLYQMDPLSIILLAASLMLFNYVLSFTKQQYWFQSNDILLCLIGGVVCFFILVERQKFLKRKIFEFKHFITNKNLRVSMLLLVFCGVYLSSSSVYMTWALSSLGYNNLINADINLWMIPGVILAGILGFIGFKKKWDIKYYILLGFFAFFIHTLQIYFIIQPIVHPEMFHFPMMVKGFGMCTLFISIWFYASSGLPPDPKVMLGLMGILMIFRTFVATAIGGVILGYLQQYSQIDSMQNMGNYWDTGLLGPAAMSMYGLMQISAILAAGKTLLGWMLWFFVPVAIVILYNNFGKVKYRRLVFVKKMLKGNSIKGYRFRGV